MGSLLSYFLRCRDFLRYRASRPFNKIFRKELTNFLKDGESGRGYSVRSAEEGLGWVQGIYWDAPCGIVLLKRGRPIACIGFSRADSGLFVKQIQGLKGCQDALSHLRWERLLLAVVIEYARSEGCQEVRVQSAEQNHWYSETYAERFRMRYNTTARRSGLQWDEEAKNFVLSLV